MRHLRQQIANTIHMMQTGCDPLVGALAAVNHGPYEILIEASDYFQISAKGFESMAAPNIEVRGRMPESAEVGVKHVLVKDSGRKHSESPMRRQRLVPYLNCLDSLQQVLKRVEHRRFHIFRDSWSQRMEGMPHMVVCGRPATEGP